MHTHRTHLIECTSLTFNTNRCLCTLPVLCYCDLETSRASPGSMIRFTVRRYKTSRAHVGANVTFFPSPAQPPVTTHRNKHRLTFGIYRFCCEQQQPAFSRSSEYVPEKLRHICQFRYWTHRAVHNRIYIGGLHQQHASHSKIEEANVKIVNASQPHI